MTVARTRFVIASKAKQSLKCYINKKSYCIYIAINQANTVLYTGVTNNLKRRMWEHKNFFGAKFTKKYKINKLVYYEEYDDINMAIAREKQIKGGSRKKKEELIKKLNPDYIDLYLDLLN